MIEAQKDLMWALYEAPQRSLPAMLLREIHGVGNHTIRWAVGIGYIYRIKYGGVVHYELTGDGQMAIEREP